ncbi:uncharacterized protein LOC118350290 [Canis lupus dingo]|uniref:uncharacterized protein LOC118350290 n=1 Tax=Canis lupus dingo TaxID=286419 RepID=UPI0020C3FE0C|nr:uncharacterized protein LOC118350290 [Canis lupus dingo]
MSPGVCGGQRPGLIPTPRSPEAEAHHSSLVTEQRSALRADPPTTRAMAHRSDVRPREGKGLGRTLDLTPLGHLAGKGTQQDQQTFMWSGVEGEKVMPTAAEASSRRQCRPQKNNRKVPDGNPSKQEATTWGRTPVKYYLSCPTSPPSTISKPWRSHKWSHEVRKRKRKDQAGGPWGRLQHPLSAACQTQAGRKEKISLLRVQLLQRAKYAIFRDQSVPARMTL